MPISPLPQPTPYTCPNCGAGLSERAEFCPHCGARLETMPTQSASGRISSLALGFGVLIFGGIGACSVGTTVSTFTHPSFVVGKFPLFISLPLLAIGLVGLFFCVRTLWRQRRN